MSDLNSLIEILDSQIHDCRVNAMDVENLAEIEKAIQTLNRIRSKVSDVELYLSEITDNAKNLKSTVGV